MKATHLKEIFIYTLINIVPYSKLLVGLNITLTLFCIGKSYGAIYYLLMEFRNNDHRYVLSDSFDELNNIYKYVMPERVSETKEETFWLKKV
jgi:hypothetical protein